MSTIWVALNAALIDSLWQFALIAGIAHLALRCVPTGNANLRYATASGALMLLPLSFAAAVWLGIDAAAPTLVTASADTRLPGSLLPALWAMGIGWQLWSLRLSWRMLGKLKDRAFNQPSATLLATLDTLRLRLGISRQVSLRLTLDSISPCTIGLLKPVVFVPLGCLTRLSSDEIEAVLAHELAHVRRYDYLSAWLQQLVKVLFYYHPATHYLLREAHRECEHSCDDLVARCTPHAQPLATALLRLTLSRQTGALSLRASGTERCLRERVARLTGSEASPASPTRLRLLPIVGLIICGTLATGAQQALQSQQPRGDSTRIEQAGLSRVQLFALKREVCDQLIVDDIYGTAPYDQGGLVHLAYSADAILINSVPLPGATQSALRKIFNRYGIEGDRHAQLRYYHDYVSLSA